MNSRARNGAIAAAVAILGGAMAQPAQAMRTYVNYDSLVISAGPGESNALTVKPHPAESGAFVIADPGATITPSVGCTGTPLGKVVICRIAESYSSGPPSLSLSLGDRSDVASVEGGFYIIQVGAGTGDDRLELPGPSDYGSGYSQVLLGAGNDALQLGGSYSAQVEVRGGEGADDITAPDTIGGYFYGESGADTIKANGWVSGGDGADTLDGTADFGWDHYFGDAGDDTIDTSDFSFDVVDCGDGSDSATQDDYDELSNCERLG